MLTLPAVAPIIDTFHATFQSVLPFLLVIVGLELAFFVLEFIVKEFREKADHQKAFNQARKDMLLLDRYAKNHGLSLTGNFSPDFTQDPGKSEQEYNAMMALATKYGVKVSSDKNVPLN